MASEVNFENTAVAFGAVGDRELKKRYWAFKLMSLRWLFNVGTIFIKFALKLHLPMEGLIRNTLFNVFCGGESIEESSPVFTKLYQHKVGAILDYSVESAESEQSFEETLTQTLLSIHLAQRYPQIPFCVFKITGLAPFKHLENYQKTKKLDAKQQADWEQIIKRVELICSEAHRLGVRVLIDAEESWIQDAIDAIALVMMTNYNREKTIVYNTYQMYRKQSVSNLREHYHLALQNEVYFGVKLVRGAYMEKERHRAKQYGYEDPIFENKQATDKAYNEGLEFCLDHLDYLALCAGSHNEFSNKYLVQLMSEKYIPSNDQHIYFSQLYGMSDHISFNLAQAGYNVTKYLPYAPIQSAIPYLIRRAEENSAISGQSMRELDLIRKELARRRSINEGAL